MRNLIILSAAISALVVVADSVQAQGYGPRANAGVPRYQPQTPTLSPYLNLLRPQGALPNYYALVRPAQQQQAFNQQSLAYRQQQAQQFRRLEQDFSQPNVLPTGTAGWFFDEGRVSPFDNTSHYYQQLEPTSQQR